MLNLTRNEQLIHEAGIELSRKHKRVEFAQVLNLQVNERHNIYKKSGKAGLTDYCITNWKIGRSAAGILVTVSRAALKFPALQEALRSERLTVSVAAKIVSSLTEQNAEALIEFACTHSCRDIEREVAKARPQNVKRDRVKTISETHVKAEMYWTIEEYDQFVKRAEALEAQKGRSRSIGEVTMNIFKNYVKREDPVKKAERNRHKKSKTQKAAATKKRVSLTAEQTHAVNFRDKGQCTWVDGDGIRCGCDRWVQIHHIQPVCDGGTNEPQNLTTLCSFHHGIVHDHL